MKRKQNTAVLFGLLAALLLGSCLPPSQCPLSSERSSDPDDRLLGYWRGTFDGANPTGHWIGRVRGKPNLLEMVTVMLDRGDHVELSRVSLYATTIAGKRFLSLQSPDRPYEFLLVRYEVPDETTCHVYLPDPERLEEEVRGGRLAGRIILNPAMFGPRIRITARTGALRDFIARHHETVFSKTPIVFRRITR